MKRSAKTRLVVTGLGACLLAGAAARAQTGPLPEQIAQHEQKLGDARASADKREEAIEANTLCNLYRQAGDYQKGLDRCGEALKIEENSGNRGSQALTKNLTGRIYTDLGQEDKALGLFNEILPLWREMGNKPGEALTLNNMGRAYNDLGQREKSLDCLNQALQIWRLGLSEGSKAGEASTLDNLGRTYSYMGQDQQAVEYFNQALPLWREVGERGGAALTLNNLGRAYGDLGKKQQALDAYQQSLALWREVGNRQGEASTLNEIGRLYRDLGQQRIALDYYGRALPLWREVGNRNGEALALNDMGRAHWAMTQLKEAQSFYDQAMPIWQETGNRRGEAATMNNLGRVYLSQGQVEKALATLNHALLLWREVQDRRGQAYALNSLGWAYATHKDRNKALACELAALGLAKEAGDPDLEGGIETALMIGFREDHRLEEAILFGTAAVNSYQKIRRNIAGLDQDLQAGFTLSKSETYRMLGELLVQVDRLGEAERVLDLLKEQELKEVVRGAGSNAETKAEPLPLTKDQAAAESALADPEKAAETVTGMSAEFAELQAKTNRTAEETARMQALEAKIEAGTAEVSDFFRKTFYPQLAQKAGTQDANAVLNREKSEVSRLQTTLASLGPRVLGIRLLLGDDQVYALLVTAQARKKYELKVTPAALRDKVLQVREVLRTPSSDPSTALSELYAMVVAPYSVELDALEHGQQQNDRPATLLWSLDGVMRYVPMGALFDGRHYLVERFNNVLFTPESYGHMSSANANGGLRVLAMGLSKSYGGLPALPGVQPELDAVAHDPSVPESHGPMDGVLLTNERFTFAAMKSQLGTGAGFPVVHIASHFVMETGDAGDEPYLMLGGDTAGAPDGYQLTLSQLEDSTVRFTGTHLLTLSACSTAKGDVAQNGLEVDSLGMIAQQKDAEAVVATLWDVNDTSTSRLMGDFYAGWVKAPAAGKAEALRHAQLAFLHSAEAAAKAPGARGLQAEAGAAPKPGNLAHPFYWAPFVLIGNYQ
jgi:CHAT domain-containing protein/Tfp pilus assembly protein PilF